MNPGFVGSDMYEKYLKSTFDMLYREGGKMMNIPMHSRIRTYSLTCYEIVLTKYCSGETWTCRGSEKIHAICIREARRMGDDEEEHCTSF